MAVETAPTYDDEIVKKFAIMAVIWGIVGMLVGVIAAAQLAFPVLNLDTPFLTFGRIRPLHTNAVIFAFGGCVLFAAIYYSLQRTCRVRLFSDGLSNFTFWGWQLVIVLAALTLPLGITQAKEYAELEWPIDILIAVVWVALGINFFGTLWKRKENHIYVGNWFFMAMIIVIAVLHIFNSMALPVSFFKSYSAYAGLQDAMVQWWYGHNAVGFFLTAGFLGIMYYFLPKQAQLPIFSYRLSILHFWTLVFLYIWAGPHHLLYTALPDWTQTLGMTFSVMLLVPSWGGMVNGLMTLKGAWDKLRTDPILKFMVVAISFYGMSTFEGPMMAIRSVNALSHYTDWDRSCPQRSPRLGSNDKHRSPLLHDSKGLRKKEMYSTGLINTHFWMATIGVVVYIVAMWISGISQGLMWKAVTADGSLTYSFAETVEAMHPYYVMRLIGGVIYLSGMLVMLYNLIMTAKMGERRAA